MKWIPLLLIVLAACAPAPVQEEVVEPVQEPVVTEKEMAEEPTGMEDIDADLAAGKPIMCTYEIEDRTETVYIQGNKVRVDVEPVDAHGIFIEAEDGMMYSWVGKQGSKISMSDVDRIAERTGQGAGPRTAAEMFATAKSVDANCKVGAFGDEVFTPPADVEFEDLSELVKEMEALAETQ